MNDNIMDEKQQTQSPPTSRWNVVAIVAMLLLATAGLLVAVFIDYLFPAKTPPVTTEVFDIGTKDQSLIKEKTDIVSIIYTDATKSLSQDEKSALFGRLLMINGKIRFTPEEKEEIYRVLHNQ